MTGRCGSGRLTFYVNYENALLAQAILFGVASALLLVFVGRLRAFLARAEGQEARWASVVWSPGRWPPGWCCCRPPSWWR
jgi:hypothetical protein